MSATLELDLEHAERIGNALIGQVNRLRDAQPIYWSERHHAWIISGHKEVAEGFGGKLPLSAKRHKLLEALVPDPADRAEHIPFTMHITPNWVTNTDPPYQLRLRKLMMKAFSRKVAEAHRDFARSLIAGLLDHVEARGDVEYMEEVARKVPASIILRMMGLADEHLPALKRWAYYSNAALGGAAPSLAVLKENELCLKEMRDIFVQEFRAREQNPKDDFLSELVMARDGKDRLTEDEMVGICHLTLIAGHDTTANSIALGTILLSNDPAARDRFRGGAPAPDAAVMEVMRLSGVSTSMPRIVAEDFEWQGHRLKQGQIVHLMIVGANRDPHVFPRPDELDFDRSQMENMTFAPGLHHCIGHFMAKMQLGEFFPALVERFASFELLDDDIQFGAGIAFRGPEHLNMRFHAR